MCPPLKHNDVRVALGGLDELLVHGFDRLEILIHDGVKAASPLLHVALDAAQNAHVRVRIDENFDVEQGADLLRCKEQDPLDDDHLCGADFHRLGRTVVNAVIIHRAEDALPRAQPPQMLDH